MTDIIILDNSDGLADYAVRVLSKSYFVRFQRDDNIKELGNGYMLDIFHSRHKVKILLERCIIVLGENELFDATGYNCDAAVIANSLNTEQIESLNNCCFPVLTCGSDFSDTVSYTSISDDIVTVSLNRTVTAYSGREVQPFEFPISISDGESIYEILAVTALRILLDDFNSELGQMY